MTRYLHVDIAHVSRGQWTGYISELDSFVYASSKPLVEYEAWRTVEECEGLHDFHLIYTEV